MLFHNLLIKSVHKLQLCVFYIFVYFYHSCSDTNFFVHTFNCPFFLFSIPRRSDPWPRGHRRPDGHQRPLHGEAVEASERARRRARPKPHHPDGRSRRDRRSGAPARGTRDARPQVLHAHHEHPGHRGLAAAGPHVGRKGRADDEGRSLEQVCQEQEQEQEAEVGMKKDNKFMRKMIKKK